MRASRGLKWENKMYKPKRSIAACKTALTDNLKINLLGKGVTP